MAKVTVVIGRFQAPTLTNAHKALLELAVTESDSTIILIGCASFPLTEHNPLNFSIRENTVRSFLSELTETNSDFQILPVNDKASDKVWSEQVDEIINNLYPFDDVTLIGSRDSFIPHYHGKHQTRVVSFKELQKYGATKKDESATEARKKVTPGKTNCRQSFNEGVIWASQNIWPRVLPCVDITVTRETEAGTEVLLGRKKDSSHYCFPGGFVDPRDKRLEQAAQRELEEETSLIAPASAFTYVASQQINDYRTSSDCVILTTLFHLDYTKALSEHNSIAAKDDLVEVKWFLLTETNRVIVDLHYQLLCHLKDKLEKDKKNVH